MKKKTEIVGIRLAPQELAAVKAEAERAHRTVSDFIRLMLKMNVPGMINEKRKTA